jgi:T5SS/PEP-CTERM-associated repeat protein
MNKNTRFAVPAPIFKTGLCGSLFLALASGAFGQTLWEAGTGDWFQPTNWTDGVPTLATDAQINNGGIAQILSGAAAAKSVGLGGGVDEQLNKGTLLVSGPSSLQVAGDIGLSNFGIGTLMILDGASVSSNSGSISGSTHFGGLPGVATVEGAGSSWEVVQELYVGGSLTVQDGGAVVSGSASIESSAVLDGPGSSWETGDVFVGANTFGEIEISNGASLTSSGVVFISDGPFAASVSVLSPGSSWNNDFDGANLVVGNGGSGGLNIFNGGVVAAFSAGIGALGAGDLEIDGVGSALSVRTSLSVGGVDFGDGPMAGEVGLAYLTNGGAITSETTLVFGRGILFVDGTLTSSSLTISPGGSLLGNGTVAAPVENAGQIKPGDFLGTLTIADDLSEEPGSALTFQINEGTNPDQQSHLSVTGNAMVDGTVEVRFSNGILPKQGDVFDLMNVSGTVSGYFTQVTFPDLRAGFQFSAEFVNGVYRITALNDAAPAAGLLNISSRAQVAPGEDALIAGFIVTQATAEQVIIRGLGPSLPLAGGTLADPNLELYDNNGILVTSNDNWMESPARQAIIDSGLAPGNNLETAIFVRLEPGSYTAVLRGAGESSGLGIVEVYNLNSDPESKLANISTRALVNTGDQVLIGGFIVDDQNTSVLLRGLGPSLANAGIIDPLSDTTLELHDSDGAVLAFNDDWRQSDEAIIQNTGLAPLYDQESAIVASLGPGAYTAILRGANENSGVGLFEVYNLR